MGHATEAELHRARLVPSSRLLLGFLVMIAINFLYLLRLTLSISMVCMVIQPVKNKTWDDDSWTNSTLNFDDNINETSLFVFNGTHATTDLLLTAATRRERGEFDWSRPYQGAILASYYYGYITTQILGGYLSGKYGAKHVVGTGVLVSVILTFVTPAATRLSSGLLIAIRVALGVAGGVFLPSSQAIWGRWAPVYERSILVSMSFLGITVGNIIAYVVTPACCEIEHDNGWPWSFYITGIMGAIFYISWLILMYSSPTTHPWISTKERNYIVMSLGANANTPRPPVPWLKLITSPAVWAILIAQTCNTWFLFTSITLPLYMSDVLKFDIKQNGLFLCLPYMIDMFTMPSAGQFSDWLRKKKIMRTIYVRKMFQTISTVGSATLLIILSFLDHERRYLAVAVLSLIYPTQNLCRSGYGVNPQDIAPRFAGEIFGITTSAGTISGMIAPVVVGALTINKSREDWQKVFFISSGMFLLGGIVFFVLGKGEVQKWAQEDKRDGTEKGEQEALKKNVDS